MECKHEGGGGAKGGKGRTEGQKDRRRGRKEHRKGRRNDEGSITGEQRLREELNGVKKTEGGNEREREKEREKRE